MKRYTVLALLIPLLAAGCKPSAEAIAEQAVMAENQIAEAQTVTPTNTSIATPTKLPAATHTPLPSETPRPTVSPLIQELLQPGRVVRHPPTEENPYSFFSYFPRSAVRKTEITVAVWPHGGSVSSNDYSHHEEQAQNTVQWLSHYAEDYGLPVVVVAIPRVDYLYVHSLHPDTFTTTEEMLRRPDLKLINAVWEQYIPAIREAGIEADSQVYMMGFSSPGMFAHRFTMLHPERVKAVWLGGEAPAPLPVPELEGHSLNYPLGTADFEALTGSQFDFVTYSSIPHFICVGENDTNPQNDTTTYTDIFTRSQGDFIRLNFGSTNPERIRFYYDFLASMGMSAEFHLYENVGHEITEQMMIDAFEFLITH